MRNLSCLATLLLLIAGVARADLSNDAVVLVNSTSPHFSEFEAYIEPYLETFGVPYETLDISGEAVVFERIDRALIIVGHKGLDESGAFLDSVEEALIAQAVSSGSGLVNFDSLITTPGGIGLYSFVQDTLGLSYSGAPQQTTSLKMATDGGLGFDCWDDAHQTPVLATTADPSNIVDNDGLWTEFHWVNRDFPAVFAAAGEAQLGLPVMNFHADGLADGTYEVIAHLYTNASGRDMTYFYGFTAGDPLAESVAVLGSDGDSEQFATYSLGTVDVMGGEFDLYVQDAILTSGTYPVFGWASVNLIPQPAADPHYITSLHDVGESVSLTASMDFVEMSAPGDATVVVEASGLPFVVTREVGQGRAVQWGSYDFIRNNIKGPVFGLDDLVWRSLVWAARKPFAMQSMPPFLVLRVDDVAGPMQWAEVAAGYGLKSWIGVFTRDMDSDDETRIAALVTAGMATVSPHSLTTNDFIYYNHATADWPDAEMNLRLDEAEAWHTATGIPMSNFVLGHFYEHGTNVFDRLEQWGVEFVGAQQDIGMPYNGSTWQQIGPYREHVAVGPANSTQPVYYADHLTIPGHPEHDGKFFNLVTEIRDNAGYEWYPSNDVPLTVDRGIAQTRRALDSRVLATLFTHDYFLQSITPANWVAILEGVLAGLDEYPLEFVTMDEAALYVRATHSSNITQVDWEPIAEVLQVRVDGETDVPTRVEVFSDDGAGGISSEFVDVPAFSGTTWVNIGGGINAVPAMSPAPLVILGTALLGLGLARLARSRRRAR